MRDTKHILFDNKLDNLSDELFLLQHDKYLTDGGKIVFYTNGNMMKNVKYRSE